MPGIAARAPTDVPPRQSGSIAGGREEQRSGRVSPELWLLLAGVVVFVATTVWWLTRDDQVQASDDGLHTLLAFGIHDQLASGDFTTWFTEFNTYPPLGHVIGALAVFVAGRSPMAVILAANLVFVPLLALSCYGVGKLAYGPRAGLLAGLFALGTPMFVSQMHMFMLDPQQAAMVAAGVWAILASRRFERTGVAALAGVVVGLAMMTKSTSVIFLAGPAAVALARGGWRNWRGLLLFLALAAAISLPWYVDHLQQLNGLVEGQGGTGAAGSEQAAPALLSRASLLWYFWAALNIQLLAPLAISLATGVAVAIVSCVRRWEPQNLAPELLAGLFVSWLGITLIRHKDARFTLAALVFVAVLATGWIALARPRVGAIATAALVLVLVADFLGVSIGIGRTVRVALPGAPADSQIATRQLTLYSPEGYVRGGPKREGDILALMRALKRAGVKTITFDAGSTATNQITFSTFGLTVRAEQAGLPATAVYDPGALGPHDGFMLLHVPGAGDPPPCQRRPDGQDVYVELGSPVKPFETYTFICPGRHPEIYARTAPLSLETELQLHPEITGAPRAMLLHVLLALHRKGVQALELDRASADKLFFQPGGLERLAELAQLPVPAGLTERQLTPSDAYLLRRPVTRASPRPCGRFPDGTGLYVVLGNPTVAHPRYICPRG
ncbi:MAG TPA: glycosyltransferase family 39 protein [Solirubrobacteraceae bacterium]|nr:glycosyltransferase family 39 protein [Solirubrobacteraceae bacterium]